MEKKMKVVQYGMGPVGNKITVYLAERKKLVIVGAVDIDPQKVGKDVGELAGLSPLGVTIQNDAAVLFRETKPDAVMLTTTSDLEKIQPQIMEILSYGINIVTTCEELSFPWKTNPKIANAIDAAAKQNGVSVLSTGVNPGFFMDFLPAALSGVCRSVTKVRIERIQNAGIRRIPFQKKVGVGLSLSEFQERVDNKTLRHVGLTESMHMIAHQLGWELDKTEDIVKPLVADKPLKTPDFDIAAGMAMGVQQSGHGYINGEEVMTLIFTAGLGVLESYERTFLEGSPGVDMKISGGVNGDIATCAINVNAIPTVVNAAPGLRTMIDLGTISCYQ